MTPDPGSQISDLGPPTSDLGLRFALRAETAIEDFGAQSLVLLCDSLGVREINQASRRLLARLDGERTVADIAGELSPADALAALLEMEQLGIVRRVVELGMERPEPMSAAKYLVNPEVSFRQEDEDGGILFNMDTDAVEVINPVAVEIWKFLAAPRTQAEVVAHLCAVCAGATRGQVEKDVAEFVDSLLGKGFIGVLENGQ